MENKKAKKGAIILLAVLLLASLAGNTILLRQNNQLAKQVARLSFEPGDTDVYIYTAGQAVVCDFLTPFKSEKDFESYGLRMNSDKKETHLDHTEVETLVAEKNLCVRVWLWPQKAEDAEKLSKLATTTERGAIGVEFINIKELEEYTIVYFSGSPETQRPEWGA